MILARIALFLGGAILAGFGVFFLFAPLEAAKLVQIIVPTPTARTDFGATYGGFNIGAGLLLLLCAFDPARVRFGLLTDGSGDRFMYSILASELTVVSLAAIALLQLSRS